MSRRWICCPSLALALLALAGCSSESAPRIDQQAAIAKVVGGEGKSNLSPKAKAADAESAKLHPKLH